jgi:subtilisin-like proprotein convertase family protein
VEGDFVRNWPYVFRVRNLGLALGAVGLVLAASQNFTVADDSKTVGRVRVTTLRDARDLARTRVEAALAKRFAPSVGKRFADRRVVSVRPRADEPQRFDVTIYDYTLETAFELVLDADGTEISRKVRSEQPARMLDELGDAYAVVRENAAFSAAIAAGTLTFYEPMPPISNDRDGRRLVNVGVMTNAIAGESLDKNEVVSVHIPTATVVRYPSGSPPTSNAALLACGPAASGCSYTPGPCSYYQVVWPAANPVWKLNVRHPSCTNSVQGDGTGLEITDVYYRGRLILKRGDVPVLNVLYDQNLCGPYRDWLYSEDCFQADGTDVPASGSGIRVANAPPSTLCESGTPGSDAGNFKGIAIYDQGNSLWLMTETNAGWYRYVMEWRLHIDGTIEPIFGFGATSNSCTCNQHHHHAYWRFEWAIDALSDGTIDDPSTGITTLERLRAGTPDVYDPIATEGTFIRPVTGGITDTWRIKNPATGNGYVVQPGALDGDANGDPYAQWDLAALAQNPDQINDPNTNTSININPWLTGETLGTTKRLVTWYHATYDHDDPGGTGEPCELAGPLLTPVVPCAGSVVLNRNTYSCASPVTVSLIDSDLAGTGTVTVAVSSPTESLAESLVLAESPAGSGQFQGTISTFSGAPIHGDGKISVANGNTLNVNYLDASACGAPNVPLNKTATIDCNPPTIGNVQSTPGFGSATIGWTTSEAARGVVHYGTTVGTPASGPLTPLSTSHTGVLSGLADCTTYYYWIESTDAAGNVAATNAGGGYFAFKTAQMNSDSFASHGSSVVIPDNNVNGATKTISVGVSAVVKDVNVTANVTHPFVGDLTLSLITPANTTIPLSVRHGGGGDNYTNTVFDDEAAIPIASGFAPFTGSYTPDSPLSAADGQGSLGDWRLKGVDSAAQDVGSLGNWTLTLAFPDLACAPGQPPPPVPDGSFGVGMKASRLTSAGSALHLTWDVGTCSAANNHLLYGTLQNVSTQVLSGAVCGLGPLGSYDWVSVPAGDFWFIVVSDDAAAKEGSWGTNSAGAQRKGATASGLCGFTTRDNSGTCP